MGFFCWISCVAFLEKSFLQEVVFKKEGEVFKTLHPVFGETVVLVAEVFKTNRLR
jgi:hypothetical protein